MNTGVFNILVMDSTATGPVVPPIPPVYPTLYPPASSFARLLAAIKTLVIAGGYYTPDRVFLTLDPDPWPSLAGPWVAIHPGAQTLVESQWAGAGSFLAGYTGEIRFRLADQSHRDQVGRDDFALLTPNTGLLDRGYELIEYLTGELPAIALTSTGLVQQPLVPVSTAEPIYRHGGVSQGDRRWRGFDIAMEAHWTHIYTLTGIPSMPIIPTPNSGNASITQLVVAIKQLIVDSGFYTAAQVFVTIDPDPWPSLAGPWVAIRIGAQNLLDEQWRGAGAYLAGYQGDIIVRVADQHEVDEVGRDDSALLLAPSSTSDLGLYNRALFLLQYLTGESVAVSLQSSGLVQQPLTPSQIGEPVYRKGGGSRGDRRWRAIDLKIGLRWTHRYLYGMS